MIRLYYLPEFWILLIAFLYGGTSMLYALYKSTKRDKKFTAFVQKYLDQEEKKNIGRGTITRNAEARCPYCFAFFRIGITNSGEVTYLCTKEKYDYDHKKRPN